MKILLVSLLLWSPIVILAQDTIYVKNGDKIPAVIVSKDNTVVKYRKSSGPGSAAVYTIFVSDIESIHYENGNIADFQNDQVTTEEKQKRAVDLAGNYNIGRVSIGIGASYFSRSGSDNLDEFWTSVSRGKTLGGNPLFYSVDLFKISFVTSQSRRNWVMSGLQIFVLPQGSIYATANNGQDEISMRSFSMSPILNYGYAFNTKKNLVAIFDPGVDFILMDGYIKRNGIKHDLFEGLRVGMHLATGIDWLFSKRFHANFRTGYRFSKAFDEDHEDDSSPTGFSHYTINGNDVYIGWKGFYASAGLSASIYFDAAKFAQSRMR